MNSEELLKQTSRAFYLSLQILPRGARPAMSLAYLLARTADSVSDGEWLPLEQRLPALREFRACLSDRGAVPRWQQRIAALPPETSAEVALLHHLPQALQQLEALPREDQGLIRGIVETLADGMEVDLRRFPGSVRTPEELKRHLWAAAGCVGVFWTQLLRLHVPALEHLPASLELLGTELGNALQLTNVLRDIPGDVREGRCYLPAEQLAELQLEPEALLDPSSEARLAPLFYAWMGEALEYYRASLPYVLSMPVSAWRLRLAALWPWALGLATLERLTEPGWLREKRKVPRSWVYRMLLGSAVQAPFTPWLRASMERQWQRTRRAWLRAQEFR